VRSGAQTELRAPRTLSHYPRRRKTIMKPIRNCNWIWWNNRSGNPRSTPRRTSSTILPSAT